MNDPKDPAMIVKRLRKLQPASAGAMQARVFYELGVAAGRRAALVQSQWKRRLVVGACLCLAIGSGVIASHFHNGFVNQKSEILPLEVTLSKSGLAKSESSDSEEQLSTNRNEATAGPPPTINRPNNLFAPLATLIAAWSADRPTMRHGFRIGPVGAAVEQIITFDSPPRFRKANSPVAVRHTFSDLIDVERTQENRLKQFLNRLL